MNPVLHRVAQPVAVHEFADALRAAAPPRFPHGRSVYHRRVGLAVSGGVDSMALAHLCAQLRRANQYVRVGDAPVSGFTALVVDHGLRAGSAAEAAAVAEAVQALGHRAQVWRLRWDGPQDGSPGGASSLPGSSGPAGPPGIKGLETNARRLRYRCLGQRLAQLRIVSLLLAHHEDDQYETVVMRLLSGYGLHGGLRGLRGMRAAVDLPECHGMYGVHRSGFLDDQREPRPYVLLRPSRRQRRRIKSDFREDMGANVWAGGQTKHAYDDWSYLQLHQLLGQAAPPLPPLDTEDLGIMAYRPLLPFAKDRLVATCLAHGVPWFEDHTNADPALTLRNAVRHLAARDAAQQRDAGRPLLPAALQKPAILQLAARCNAAARQHEAEARRLMVRHRVVVRFATNVGTVVARPPRLRPHARRRPWSSPSSAYTLASHESRRRHLRSVAALVVQNLLALVTPEANVTPVSQLQGIVDTLFPDLRDPFPSLSPSAPCMATPPKALMICGVHLMPLLDKTASPALSWYLARAPYYVASSPPHGSSSSSSSSSSGTTAPVAQIQFPALSLAARWDRLPAQWPWSSWSRWVLYDGRFWVRVRTRLPVHVQLQPFDKAHSKPFREALAAGGVTAGGAAAAFQATLKAFAPGKVRYTLPALYTSGDISWALDGRPYWPSDEELAGVSVAVAAGEEEMGLQAARFHWERELRRAEQASWPHPQQPAWRLLALPTLGGVHIPGIEHWLQWEVRYRKVDTALLESSSEATAAAAALGMRWAWH